MSRSSARETRGERALIADELSVQDDPELDQPSAESPERCMRYSTTSNSKWAHTVTIYGSIARAQAIFTESQRSGFQDLFS